MSNRALAAVLALFLPLVSTAAETYHATTFAGTGAKGDSGDGGPATQATLSDPFGLARSPLDGAIYFCEFSGHRIRRVDPATGVITTVAGTGQPGGAGDGGPATQAQLNEPHEIRFDPAGNYFVSDMKNHAIRRVDGKTGIITTALGNGTKGYSGDGGAGNKAQLSSPISLQFSPNGDLFVCDLGNHAIRKLDGHTGDVTTVCGTGKPGPTPDGAPIAAATPLNGPRSLDFDSAGHLWLCTREGNQVLEFDFAANQIHVRAGTGKKGAAAESVPAGEATFNGPKGIAVTASGEILLADTENHVIRRIDPKSGLVTLLAGIPGQKGDGPVGDPLAGKLARPHGIFAERDGTLFISNTEGSRVLRLTPLAPR